jgi:Zn-finger nucleic acid-binding protein
MNIEDCPKCQRVFMSRPALQAELSHEAAKYGMSAAQSLLAERLEDEHATH